MNEAQSNEIFYPEPLNIELAQKLLREKFKVIIDDHDPIMMFIEIHRAALKDYEIMLSRHDQKIADVVTKVSQESAFQVNQSLEILKDEALKSSLENVLAGVSEKAKLTEKLSQRMSSMMWAFGILTLLNLCGIAALFFILK